jgi:hypothetical protein
MKCDEGCETHVSERERYVCAHETCGKENLCVGCIWQCADCSGDFCETHVSGDVTPQERFQTYVCIACLTRREERESERRAA